MSRHSGRQRGEAMDIVAKRFGRDTGEVRRIGRMTFFLGMSAEDTQGAYTVMEAIVPPDSGSGRHRHWSFDEAAFILDGRFECFVDGSQKELSAGESVYWPRGAIHQFRSIGPGDGRILFICSPGKIFEDFINQLSTSGVESGTAVSGAAVDFRAIAARHGIEFID